MGTVGLSFGSPTSGAGFDVSTTVSAIVANLQNVETPWKTQLTKLESQDTRFPAWERCSRICPTTSVHSRLSGHHRQKEGSSSDQNVLTLTAANASAVAGTHTVQVQNLARRQADIWQWSKRYHPLTGSITLQTAAAPRRPSLWTHPTTLSPDWKARLMRPGRRNREHIDRRLGIALDLVSGTSGRPVTSLSREFARPGSGLHGRGQQWLAKLDRDIYIRRRFDRYSLRLIFGADRSGQTENVVIGAAPSSRLQTPFIRERRQHAFRHRRAITAAGIGVTAAAVTTAMGRRPCRSLLELQVGRYPGRQLEPGRHNDIRNGYTSSVTAPTRPSGGRS